jgi:ADP-ribosylglycohydrolase
MTNWPTDYLERVYAGVLGKIIGVYVGRPFEGWTHERIVSELGEITYYVHEKLNKPLIVIDDDISGTFTFLRAMPDHGVGMGLTPAQCGETWLNYLIENRTVLWWGGMGMSTEHTAYLRLKNGIPAPASGSIALNGQVVAEQIGAQIFIDGWGLICPGDPERAADLARRAASVSHDGEAIYGAQVVAGLVAQAFVESRVPALLDTATSLIPGDSLIYRLIGDVREWHARYPSWYDTFHRVAERYGYHKYGGNCHMVPNHAVVIMALLYSEGDFARGMTVVNTAGWDTDCNSGNVGCILGVANGLAGIEAGPDWRGPVGDRMVLPTADTGRAVTDAANEALRVASIGCDLAGIELPALKGGARYHFELPGSVQGFLVDDAPECRGIASLCNVPGHSATGTRSLKIALQGLARGRSARVRRETYPDMGDSGGYGMVASPTLYPGQTVRARLVADAQNAQPLGGRVYIQVAGAEDRLELISGPAFAVAAGESEEFTWEVTAPEGCPIHWVGLEFASDCRFDGAVYIDYLTWDGEPNRRFGRPAHGGTQWLKAWTRACSVLTTHPEDTYRMIQNEGRGLMIQGTREWRDYTVEATLTANLARSMGIAARVQGLKRYYALELGEGVVRLVRERYGTTVLASCAYDWSLYRPYRLSLTVSGTHLVGRVDEQVLFDLADDSDIRDGAVAIVLEEGRIGCENVCVRPT